MSRHAILLDALGTLLALEPPAPLLRGELAGRFGIEVSQAAAQHAITAEIGYYRDHLDEGRDDASVAALRCRCAEVMRTALPASPALRAVTPQALTDALLASLRFSVYADVVPALRDARARGERLVVVSNWDASLAGVLDARGLMPLIDGVLTSAIAGAPKPSAAIFEQALSIAGARREHALHVGDSLEADVAGALGAGIEPILLRRDGTPGPEGVRTLATLAQLTGAPAAARGALRREP